MRQGTVISAAGHLGAIVLVLVGPSLFSGSPPHPMQVTNVELVDGAKFDAQLSTAPVVPNKGPSDLSPKSQADAPKFDLSAPDTPLNAPDMPLLSDAAPAPEKNPDFASVIVPPPKVVVPTEAPRPSIAEVPSPDPVKRQAPTPESPPSTEPVQALASAPTLAPAPAPAPPPEPKPVASDTPQPKPEKPKQKPDPTSVAQANPDAPVDAAPQQAALPVARPAKLAAAAQASSAPPPVKAAPKPKDQPKKPQQAQPGGSKSKFAAVVTQGEKDALVIDLKKAFVNNGGWKDPNIWVTIRVTLNPDGTLAGKPEQIKESSGDPRQLKLLFSRGQYALYTAARQGTFAKLPADKYDAWRVIDVTFTPKDSNVGVS